jgi:hypothetical protein
MKNSRHFLEVGVNMLNAYLPHRLSGIFFYSFLGIFLLRKVGSYRRMHHLMSFLSNAFHASPLPAPTNDLHN